MGQATFAKLRDLASPRDIVDLSLGDIMELLKTHYRPQTVEIAERYKFFKRTQGVSERTADFMAELRWLAKTCNFGQYLETALRDQFVCGLRDEKCQRELLSIQDLTAEITIRQATAAEVVSKETQAMQESATGPVMLVKFTSCLVNLSVIAVGSRAINRQIASARMQNVILARKWGI